MALLSLAQRLDIYQQSYYVGVRGSGHCPTGTFIGIVLAVQAYGQFSQQV